MRLLRIHDDLSLSFEEFLGRNIPRYAILSHTWEEEEVSYKDFTKGCGPEKSYEKIRGFARQARKDKVKYIWVDTCCIDKRSSAELTEAINSMYAWYRDSWKCYVYLADVPDESWQQSRWLTRGWTLQELIAPTEVMFYNSSWKLIGRKSTWSLKLSEVTGILDDILGHYRDLRTVPAAIKMSWASTRTTTRLEDEAYCLMGLFDVHMPLLYGEGKKAFMRLQEAIASRTSDSSILAWAEQSISPIWTPYASALASSARAFVQMRKYTESSREHTDTFDLDKHGAHFRAYLRPLTGERCVYEATLSVTLYSSPDCPVRPGVLLLNISELNGELELPHKYVRVQQQHVGVVSRSPASGQPALQTVSLINPTEDSWLRIARRPSMDAPMLLQNNRFATGWYTVRLSHSLDESVTPALSFLDWVLLWKGEPTALFFSLDAFGRPRMQLFAHQLMQTLSKCISVRQFQTEVHEARFSIKDVVANLAGDLPRHQSSKLTATARISYFDGEVHVEIIVTPDQETHTNETSELDSRDADYDATSDAAMPDSNTHGS